MYYNYIEITINYTLIPKHILLQWQLGWQLPQVMPNYPSDTFYYPFLKSNGVTQIRVMVKPLCESQA